LNPHPQREEWRWGRGRGRGTLYFLFRVLFLKKKNHVLRATPGVIYISSLSLQIKNKMKKTAPAVM
jgi:hypothetical protein